MFPFETRSPCDTIYKYTFCILKVQVNGAIILYYSFVGVGLSKRQAGNINSCALAPTFHFAAPRQSYRCLEVFPSGRDVYQEYKLPWETAVLKLTGFDVTSHTTVLFQTTRKDVHNSELRTFVYVSLLPVRFIET